MNELQGVWTDSVKEWVVICYEWSWSGSGIVRMSVKVNENGALVPETLYQKFPRTGREIHIKKIGKGRNGKAIITGKLKFRTLNDTGPVKYG